MTFTGIVGALLPQGSPEACDLEVNVVTTIRENEDDHKLRMRIDAVIVDPVYDIFLTDLIAKLYEKVMGPPLGTPTPAPSVSEAEGVELQTRTSNPEPMAASVFTAVASRYDDAFTKYQANAAKVGRAIVNGIRAGSKYWSTIEISPLRFYFINEDVFAYAQSGVDINTRAGFKGELHTAWMPGLKYVGGNGYSLIPLILDDVPGMSGYARIAYTVDVYAIFGPKDTQYAIGAIVT